MKRTQVQLDERTYEALRRAAYEQGRSISSIVRDTLAEALDTKVPGRIKRMRLSDFGFVGSGRSRQGKEGPVSERHDEALARTLGARRR
jgi:hypothetical protein